MAGEVILQCALGKPNIPVTGAAQLAYLLIEVKPTGAVANARMPVNFSLVLDHSRSMSGAKLQNLKAAIQLLLDQMQPQDYVSLVIFDDDAYVVFPCQSAGNRDQLKALVDGILAGGGRVMSKGLALGLAETQKALASSRISRIILLTDGQTYGDEDECHRLAIEAGRLGVPIITLGLGNDWDEALLETIARFSNGVCDYVDTPSKIGAFFASALQSMVAAVVRNARLTMRLSGNVILQRAWQVIPRIARLGNGTPFDSDMQVSLGEIEKDSGQALLLEILLPARSPGHYRIGQVEVTYDVPALSIVDEKMRAYATLTVTEDANLVQQIDLRVMNLVEKVTAFKPQTQVLTAAPGAANPYRGNDTMSQCPQCGTTNRSGARFCSACGNQLTTVSGIFDPATGKLLPGVALDRRYTIERIVSRRGGMSTIYLARDGRFGNQYCIIKEMLDHFADPAERQQTQAWFAREASTLRNLKHPNIPQVIDHFSEYGRHYLVMDWIDGGNLEDALMTSGAPGLPEDRVLLWGIRLCEVLEYLHTLQPPLLFRDLKPANLMLTRDDEVHLIDFGIARKFDPGQLGKMTVVGTPGYCPPEQYSGRAEPRSDLYALGATLHHLLTGQEPVPFSFRPAHMLNSKVSPEVSAVLERVLDNDIEQRYESATKMKQALQMCQGVFNIGYGFVRPYLPPHTDDLCQILVDLYSRDGADLSKSQIMTHLVLVLDVSGSMDHPEKYPFLLEAVRELSQSEFMGNDDTLSVVVFSEDSEVRVASRPFAECKANPDRIVYDIDDETGKRQVKFGGHTYLAPGLREALAQVRAFRAVFPDAVNRLYILTDGQIHDEQIACQYTTEIRQLDVEINAYGFGTDFDDKVLASVMQGCRGATIKPILDANELVRTFGHVAEISGNIIATDAEFAFALASNVRVGDVFCYRPRDEYFGSRAFDMQKVFRTKIGALEKGRNYSYCFEVGLMPSQPGRQEIGMINLSYNLGRRRVTQYQRIMITRTADAALTGQVDREAQAVVDVVHGLRDKDSASQLRSLKARRMLAVQARSHSTIIQAFDKAISDLEQGGSLSSLTEVERRLLTCQIQTNLLTAVK